MIVGVPKEVKDHEARVGLVPSGVGALVEAGHQVLIETGAGEKSTLSDAEYEEFGAEIVSSAAEVWRRSDLVVKVKEPQPSEYALLRPGLTAVHLSASCSAAGTDREAAGNAGQRGRVRNDPREGRLAAAAYADERSGRAHGGAGGRAVPGGAERRPGHSAGRHPGCRPANVVILGGGVVGHNAAKMAVGLGAHVTIIDKNLDRLRTLGRHLQQPDRHARIEYLDDPRDLASCRPGGRRGADSRRFGAEAGAARDDPVDEAGRGGRGRRDRSGRLLRDIPPHDAHRSDVLRRRRAALLRVEYAGGSSAHVHVRSDQRDISLRDAAGIEGSGEGVRGLPAICEGVNTYQGHVTYPGRCRVAGPPVERTFIPVL